MYEQHRYCPSRAPPLPLVSFEFVLVLIIGFISSPSLYRFASLVLLLQGGQADEGLDYADGHRSHRRRHQAR